jgi:dynein light intermediate chain 1
VPPNWDSWGKIRVLREGFDVEGVNNGWSVDIEDSTGANHPPHEEAAALAVYEETIRDPRLDTLQAVTAGANGHEIEVASTDTQTFLASQLEVLEKLTKPSDNNGVEESGSSVVESVEESDSNVMDDGRVNEHIGPVQFNMGGIQVDADDMLQRLKV